MDFVKHITTFSCLVYIFTMANAQTQGCSVRGIDLQHCLNSGQNPYTFGTCCTALNHAVEAGYYCLCSLFGSSNPAMSARISLSFSTCYISLPPLTHCRGPYPPPSPPQIPGLSRPPASPRSDDPMGLPQASTPVDIVVPSHPKFSEIHINTTGGNSSWVDGQPSLESPPKLSVSECRYPVLSNGEQNKVFLCLTSLLGVALCSFIL